MSIRDFICDDNNKKPLLACWALKWGGEYGKIELHWIKMLKSYIFNYHSLGYGKRWDHLSTRYVEIENYLDIWEK